MIFRERYQFIGQDGSLGLKHGENYIIDLKRHLFSKRVVAQIYLSKRHWVFCPYTSMETFKQNWKIF